MAAKKKSPKKKKPTNEIPIEVLEKRARKLAKIVRARGGKP